jgi:hypothetical protein
MKKLKYIYVDEPKFETIYCSSHTEFDGTLRLYFLKKVEGSKRIRLSSIKEKIFVNGFGWYDPKEKKQ